MRGKVKLKKINFIFYMMSSKGIEPLTAINQFFYREPPLPIGSPALNIKFNNIFKFYLFSHSPQDINHLNFLFKSSLLSGKV